jgi:hypothetical protein
MAKRPIKQDGDYAPPKHGNVQMLIGMLVAVAIVAALLLTRQESWTFSLIDAAFWGVVAGACATRYVLVAKLRQQPADKGWSRLVLGLIAACAVWLAAQAVGEPVE